MNIDVVLEVVIWMVNWLHYLNCESISCGSSILQYFVQRTSLDRNVTSCGFCDIIPRVVPVFSSFIERLRV